MNFEYTSLNSPSTHDIKQDDHNNGRINLNIQANENGTPFFIQEQVMQDDKTNYFNAMKHTLQTTRLSSVFFCKENIDIIQNAIRAGVYEYSKKVHIIDRQDPDTLKVIIYNTYNTVNIKTIHHQQIELSKKLLEIVFKITVSCRIFEI